MTKKSKDRKAQEYEKRKVIPMCGNCEHLDYCDRSCIHLRPIYRCGLGDFKVIPIGICKKWENKKAVSNEQFSRTCAGRSSAKRRRNNAHADRLGRSEREHTDLLRSIHPETYEQKRWM